MGTVLAIGLLIGICGLIAYIGDLLGRRMGKRRLSLWGLRPRHTAVLFTVVTGMLIAVFSLLVLVGLSAGIRRAVLQGEALLHENRVFREDNARQTHNLQVLRTQVHEQSTENKRLVSQEKGLSLLLERRRQRNAELRGRNDALNSELGQLEARIAALTLRQRRLEARERTLIVRNDHLKKVYADAKGKLSGAQVQLTDARAELEGTRQALRKMRNERARFAKGAFATLGRLRAREVELADERIIARADEELARVVLLSGPDRRAIRDTVESVMRQAEYEVRERHQAAGGSAPQKLIVWQPLWAKPSDIVSTLVSWSAVRGEPLVLRVVTDENAPAGSTVTARLKTAPRRLAFRAGEEIAAATLDGRKSEGELLRSLIGFLQGTVRRQALRRSVLPAGDGVVGELPYDPLLATIKRVREVGGPARVSAVAASEIRSEGPLQLDFRVLRWEGRVSGDP